jgi:hypothetical protein
MSAAEPGSRRTRIAAVSRFTLGGLAAGAIGGVTAYEAGAPAPWIVGVACLIGVLLVGVLLAALADYHPPAGAPVGDFPRKPTDRESGGLRRVERTIETGLRDVDRFNLRVRPWLVHLAEQRLVHRAGIDLTREPDAARDLLGADLWQLTQQPRTTAPTQREVGEWIARLEAL